MDWNGLIWIAVFLFAVVCLIGVGAVVQANWEQDKKEREEEK